MGKFSWKGFAIGAALLVIGLLLIHANSGGSGSKTYSADDLATVLAGNMAQDSNFANITIGTVTCDSGLTNVGDVALCDVQETQSDGTTATVQWDVKLIDNNGHFSYTGDHAVSSK